MLSQLCGGKHYKFQFSSSWPCTKPAQGDSVGQSQLVRHTLHDEHPQPDQILCNICYMSSRSSGAINHQLRLASMRRLPHRDLKTAWQKCSESKRIIFNGADMRR
jgi:hypothetical protein